MTDPAAVRTPTLAIAALALALAAAGAGVAWPQGKAPTLAQRIDRLAVDQVKSGLEEQAQRNRLADLNKQEAAVNADLANRRGELAKLLGMLATFRRHPPPALLAPPDKARDAVRGAILAKALTPELTRRAQVLSAQLQQIAVLRRQAAAANAVLFAEQSEQAERSSAIANALQERALQDSLLAERGPQGADAGLGPLSEGGDGSTLRLAWPVKGQVSRRFGEGSAQRRPRAWPDHHRAQGRSGDQSGGRRRSICWRRSRLGCCLDLEDQGRIPFGARRF